MSMGEETMGVRMLILRVSLVVRSTCAFSGRFVVRHGAQGKVGASDSKGAAGLVGAAERRGPCSGTHVGRGEVDVTGVEDDIIVGVADACRRERRVGRGSVRLRREGVGNSEIAAPSVHQRALLSLTTSHVPWPKSWAALKRRLRRR